MSKNLIEACLVFFCLLLGVTIGRAACYSDQVSIECSLNADQFAPGDVMQGFLSADNGGAWVMVDVYVAFVMPDGTIYTLTPSSPEGDMAPYISNVSLPPGLVGPVMIFELVVPGGLAPGVYSYMAAIMPSASFELLAMDVMDFEITPPGPVSNVKMIPIPAGSFLMGSPDGEAGRDDDEGPQRTVNTSAFLMAETEVTEKQWEDVMGWNDSHQKLGDDYPVENVTYFDCLSFCNELSKSKGLAECYTLDITDSGGDHIYGADVTVDFEANGYRLPTEAEWEYACRAGATSRFYTGDSYSDLDEAGWHVGNSELHKREVAQKEPNAFGLYDMHGNVWEWCWDWFASDYYESRPDPDTDPTGPESGAHHVLRGGSWYSDARHCRSASRYYYRPFNSERFIGLRVARRN